jgi:ubiquinone/menaquinone biosynthesis C-methylase UbiE
VGRVELQSGLPAYDEQQSWFHEAFSRELEQIVRSLPLTPGMKVLDLACGNGFYTRRISRRLGRDGAVTGVDVNRTYLAAARSAAAHERATAKIELVAASFDRLPFADATFDFAWCAQSLYSLPEPVVVLGHLARVLRPGGILAVLENDTMHQVFLPWPARLELPLRTAELRALECENRHPSKFYVGRHLPAVFAAAGLEPLNMSTHPFDRQAPLARAERRLLQSYLDEVTERVAPHLEPALLDELRALRDPRSPSHMLREPHLTMTWLNVLGLARKPQLGEEARPE